MYTEIPMKIFFHHQINLNVYLGQFENYCTAYSIKADRKVSLFLASIGQSRDLFLSKDFAEQSFDKIKGILRDYFQYKSNVIVERFKFHSLRQSELQSLYEYVIQLRKQAAKCEFGSNMEEMIRDKIVISMAREDTRR